MRMIDIIEKKRDGRALTREEIQYFVKGYVDGTIPDYQVSALLMAVYFNGMTKEETAALTMAMVESGEQIDLSAIQGIKVDKHSTGGVGDTVTLIIGPLVASCDVPVAKMSGRGLGHTGGTIDKLESIPGFNVEITTDEFIRLVNQNKIAVVGQTGNLTPADKKLYALRDVTGTVESVPLIASSIMSKKIAAGADCIVLDVKAGDGAFMKTVDDAKKLARSMVDIGSEVGRKTIAIISNMNQPLGYAIGNALEVEEAIATLKGEGPEDLTELSLTIASYMVRLAGKADTIEEAREMLEAALRSGKALEKMRTFIVAQGGDGSVIEETDKLPRARYQIEFRAEKEGWIKCLHAENFGHAAGLLGAGRTTKESEINLAVGLVLHKKVGDFVQKGEPLVTIHTDEENIAEVEQILAESIEISPEKVEKEPLIFDVIQ
ncbi:MAG: pyrimidine-nucleoside phosphorylase [Caldibacillus sp.]